MRPCPQISHCFLPLDLLLRTVVTCSVIVSAPDLVLLPCPCTRVDTNIFGMDRSMKSETQNNLYSLAGSRSCVDPYFFVLISFFSCLTSVRAFSAWTSNIKSFWRSTETLSVTLKPHPSLKETPEGLGLPWKETDQ